jgi:hypothetical protein
VRVLPNPHAQCDLSTANSIAKTLIEHHF